jgi:hypothetical protein
VMCDHDKNQCEYYDETQHNNRRHHGNGSQY